MLTANFVVMLLSLLAVSAVLGSSRLRGFVLIGAYIGVAVMFFLAGD